MKWPCFLLLLCYFVSPKAQNSDQLLDQANALLTENPRQAAALYDSLRLQGLVSPALFLAQGNAYLQTGNKGKAVLAYERGLRLRPGHKALKNNLKYAETQLDNVLVDLPGFFLVRWWKWLGSRLGITASYVLAGLCWWLAVAAFGWWFFRRDQLSERRRFMLLPASVIGLLLAITFFTLGNSRTNELMRRDQAVVISGQANLRVAPGPEATLEQIVTAGQRLQIVDEFQQQYFKVSLRDGKQGWLSKADLEVI